MRFNATALEEGSDIGVGCWAKFRIFFLIAAFMPAGLISPVFHCAGSGYTHSSHPWLKTHHYHFYKTAFISLPYFLALCSLHPNWSFLNLNLGISQSLYKFHASSVAAYLMPKENDQMTNTFHKLYFILALCLSVVACQDNPSDLPVVGFVDAFEDSTIGQAKDGFLTALKEAGYSEDAQSLKVIYRNAQGDIPTLTQIVRYMVAEEVTLLATSPSLSTITAVQNTQDIPIFMMVAPTPELMKVQDAQGNDPPNLYGIAENLAYIDTSFSIIPQLVQPAGAKLRIGLLYNQSEPQSVSAFERLQDLANRLGVELVARAVHMTADVQLTTGALLNEGIDAFFANPDNTVFGSFETILKACNEAGVPVFTSEAGLVERGAVAAFGADLYQWGHQAGEQAAAYLNTRSTQGLHWEMVKLRKRVYNPEAAASFELSIPDTFDPIH